MTIPTNTFVTYSAVGNREDLSNIIYNISPTETPFMSMIAAKTKAASTLHEWQIDSLTAAADNAQIQGDDATGVAITATSRINNRTQISAKTIIVSETQMAVDTAGRANELAYQVEKASREIKRDMETALTGNYTAVTGTSTVAPHLRSLEAWYTTNDSRGTNGADGSSTQAATDATTAGVRAFTETLLKDVIQLCYTAGGKPDVVMMGPSQKRVFSGFTGNSSRVVNANEKELFAGIDIYQSDFGMLKAVPNRFQRARSVHVLQSDMWGVAYLRPFSERPLAKTGDAEKRQMIVEYTLEARNEASSGVVADLT